MIKIKPCTSADTKDVLKLRSLLWSHCSADQHIFEINKIVSNSDSFSQFIAQENKHLAVGFIEASLRSDYVNGTTFSPVAFIEGMYVIPEFRCKGIARDLINEVIDWAKSKGCKEIASDADINNELSHIVHTSLGFKETERVVYFVKNLVIE